MNLKSLNGYIYLNSKREKLVINIFLNLIIILLSIRLSYFFVMLLVYMIFQTVVNVEFAKDGVNNIYLFLMGEPLKSLTRNRTIARILIKALMILPSILIMAIWKKDIIIIFFYLIAIIASYIIAIFRLSLNYKYDSKVLQMAINYIMVLIFVILILNPILDYKLKLLAIIIIFAAMIFVSNKILDNCSIEKIYTRGEN
ncbi:MAG: hypothetical protein Q4P29_07855 [Tissierellia bacterium]|nr:hypothetical protein [Tissierellia bacterium]